MKAETLQCLDAKKTFDKFEILAPRWKLLLEDLSEKRRRDKYLDFSVQKIDKEKKIVL